MEKLIHTRHSVGQSAYHFVWRPKYNVKVFAHPWVRSICEDAFKEVAQSYNFVIYEMNVQPDHIHLFVEVPSTISVSKTMQLFKGISARRIFQKCTKWKKFFTYDGQKPARLWSPGKFFRSVGCVKADVIANYIANSQEKWDFDYLSKYQKTLKVY